MALPALLLAVALAVACLASRWGGRETPPADVIAQTIRYDVGRQLREAGATYEDLAVKVAVRRDNATPFEVSYRGLSHFPGNEGTAPRASGSFIMEYIGAGRWQGSLAGTPLTVVVGSKDNIHLAFVPDPQVLGQWQGVDFVKAIADFQPEKTAWKGDLYLQELTFLAEGKTTRPWWTWTKGVLIHRGDQTASHYEIHEIQGRLYLFLEWKSGDFTVLGRKPHYYVLRRLP